MDFLDPLKRRRRRQRLLIGYVLLGLVLIIGTVILVFITYGYGFNTSTRTIVQNGLLFVDSKPGGANVYLNGFSKNARTDARLVLPAGPYQLGLKRDGYRDWQRSFKLKEQSVLRLEYALLIPKKLSPEPLKKYAAQTSLFSLSPDRHWLLVGGLVDKTGQTSIDRYDTNRSNPAPEALNLPDNLLPKPGRHGGQLEPVEWSSDNRHLLAKYSYGDHQQFVVIDRRQPSQSVNLNKLFKANPGSVSLRDKRSDQFYFYGAKAGTLQVALLSPTALAQPFLKNVYGYAGGAPGVVFYAVKAKSSQIAINIWQNGQSYNLLKLHTTQPPSLLATRYLNHWYYVVGSPSSQFLNIYRDPVDILSRPSPPKVDPFISLKIARLSRLSVSPTARFIIGSNGHQTVSLDLELDLNYRYDWAVQSLQWADDFHLFGQRNQLLQLADYDGANIYKLNAAASAALSNDHHRYFSLGANGRQLLLEATVLNP